MNNVQTKLIELTDKGWTVAAIADELEVHHMTVRRWQSATRYPENVKGILVMLDALAKRRRIPKQRRYAPGSRIRKADSDT